MGLANRQHVFMALLVERIGQDMDAEARTTAAGGDLMGEGLEIRCCDGDRRQVRYLPR